MTKSKVGIIRTEADSVLEDIERVMDNGDMSTSLDNRSKTILKDNISWHNFFPSANTTPWQLEGSILALKRNGFEDLIAVHNNTVVTDAVKGGAENNLDQVYQKYSIPEIYNYKPEDVEWIKYKPTRKTPALDRVYPEGFRIPGIFVGTNIVHLPTVKCHIYTTTTGAMKNAFGGLLNSRRHYSHSFIHRTLVDLLIVQKEIHSGIFALMDGTHAGDGPGPRTMRPVQKNVILASGDQVAIDAVAAKLMGFDPLSIEYIRIAHEEGLGIGDPRDIELVGDSDLINENWQFKVGENFVSLFGHLFWFSPLKRIQRLLFHTPLLKLFVFASYFYHDHIWYPLKSKPILNSYRNTEWGKLFYQKYGKEF